MPTVTRVGCGELTTLLKKRYGKSITNKVTLIDLPMPYQMDIIIQTLKLLTTEQAREGIYISTLKVYDELIRVLEEAYVDLSRVHIVDAISRMYGLEPAENKRCVFVSSPVNIQSINSAVVGQLAQLKGTPFVLLDSLTTILLYNSVQRIVDFTKKMAQHIKGPDTNGLLLMVSTAQGAANQKLVSELSSVIDDIIRINMGK